MSKTKLNKITALICAVILLFTGIPVFTVADDLNESFISLNISDNNLKQKTILIPWKTVDGIIGGYDTTVADVSVKSIDNLTWNNKTFTNLAGCEYTFTSASANSFIAKSNTVNGLYFTPVGVWVSGSTINKMTTQFTNSSCKYEMNLVPAADGAFYISNVAKSAYYSNALPVMYLGMDISTCRYECVSSPSASGYQCAFWLYYKDQNADENSKIPGYSVLSDLSEIDGKSLLVVTFVGDVAYIMYPDSARNYKDLNRAVYTRGTEITFTAKAVGETSVRVGDTNYNISVSDVKSATLTSPANTAPAQTVYIRRGDSVNIQNTYGSFNTYTFSKSGVANATLTTDGDIRNSYVKNLNTNAEITAEKCLYTFTAVNDGYKIPSADFRDGTAVDLNITSTTVNTVQNGVEHIFSVLPSSNGKFTLTQTENGKQFYFNHWLNFCGEDNTANAKVYDFALYTPESNPQKYAAELPGYSRAFSVESGKQYLIAAVYGDKQYFVCPAKESSVSIRNIHTALNQSKCFASAPTDIKVDGLTAGYTVLNVGGTQYTVVVYEDGVINSNTGEARGKEIKHLTISLGDVYYVMRKNANDSWNTANSSIASVTALDGVSAVISGNMVGTTTVTCNYAGQESTLVVNVVDTMLNSTGNAYLLNTFVANTYNTRAFFTTLRNDAPFTEKNIVEIYDKQDIYLKYPASSSVATYFYGKPDENCVLTLLGATGSENNYRKIDNADPTKTEMYLSTPTIRYGNYIKGSVNEGAQMIEAVAALGCYGGFTFTLNHSLASSLTFRSEHLPETEVAVFEIIRTENGKTEHIPYQDGVSVKKNDSVIFEAAVTIYDAERIKYSDAVLKASLGTPSGFDISTIINTPQNGGIDYETVQKNGKTYRVYKNIPTTSGGTIPELLVVVDESSKDVDGSVKYYFEIDYTVTEKAALDFSKGIALENHIGLEYSYVATFQSSQTSISNTSSAVAILTVDLESKLKYMNLGLGGAIVLNVYIVDSEDTSGWYGNTDYSLAFSKVLDGNEEIIKTVGFENPLPCVIEGEHFWRFTAEIPPKEMATDYIVYVVNSQGEAVSAKSTVLNVRDYALRLKAEKNDLITTWQVNSDKSVYEASTMGDNLCDLVDAMLNYGTKLQLYSGYNTGKLPVPENTAFLSKYNDLYNAQISNDISYIHNAPGGIQFTGVAMVLSGVNTSLRLFFDYEREDSDKLIAENQYILENENQTLFKFTDNITSVVRVSKNKYYIEISDISSTWLSNTYRVSITTEKTKLESFVELTPLTYASLLKDYGGDITLQNLVRALFDYNSAAVAYFGSNKGMNP